MTSTVSSPQLEDLFGFRIEQVGINDCIYEDTCEGSCHAELKIFDDEVYRVQTNTSSVIGAYFGCGVQCVSASVSLIICVSPLVERISVKVDFSFSYFCLL